ncbi:MAG: signal recognition particle-docking protein FtsY [Candidatus Kapabacteria bacterium]|nr:signal recognition particle-docking protein FtsY [Ignavibacteriota bacterium]MCW5883581.1 signal recognition particle-docking protein FtsY [Candidatus Kapabacteria bacterium]
MSFFSKLKEKFTEKVDKVQEKVSTVISQAGNAIKFDKIKDGLQKTRVSFIDKFQALLGSGRKIDNKLIEEIEEILITADIGVETAEQIISKMKLRVKKEGFEEAEDLYNILKEEIHEILLKTPSAANDSTYSIDESKKPHVIMVIGVNGAGKTTTIGKLAHNYKKAGKNVIIGAADTFRAAANEQLEVWAQRAEVDIIQQSQGSDPAAVVFDTLKSAISNKKDVVIIDTAGRLHNKVNLMQELEKLSRVMKKHKSEAPDEVFLVLDATTGQNAVMQAKEFMKVAPITGIVLTKLDGTAKGGVVIPIASELKIPVRYIGVGEKIDDLQVFDPSLFVEALFGLNEDEISEME